MSRWIARLRGDSGQTLVVAAFGITGLLGFAALATDVGVLFRFRRNVQIAADAAAVAGAVDYLYNGTTDGAKTAAKSASSSNGVTDGTDGATVTVNIPPSSGPNAGNAAFVEAIVSKPGKTIFMGMFGRKTMTVTARAVAGTPTTGQVCIWLMANSGKALDLQGSYTITAHDCGIYVNSNTSDALTVTGNGGTIDTLFLDVVGNTPPGHQTQPTPSTMNTSPRKSPWGNLTGPTEANGGCTTIDKTTTTVSGDVSASAPGLGHAICYQKAVTLNGATLGPGVYMFEKGVTISGTVTVNGGTLDIYGGTFNQPSNTLVNITAPTSGTYNGIAIMQPAINTNNLQVQFGSNNQKLDGYIYAPGAEVFLQDSGGGTTYTGIVAASMYDKTSKITIPSYDKQHPTTTLNRVVTLVE